MKKSTHSKIKNTAILFELLSRQIAADTISGKENSPAIRIIKEFFNGNTNLAKELTLYQSLVNESYKSKDKANFLINAVIRARKSLNLEKLRVEKYNLIKEVKTHYDLKAFFKTPLSDYKLYASIYRVFEGSVSVDPKEIVNSRFTIIEHIVDKKMIKRSNDAQQLLLSEYANQDESVRLLAYRLLVDKFNDKYKNLSEKQKTVLKEYINNVSNTVTLKTFIIEEASVLKKELLKQIGKIGDKVIKIKLNEVVNLLGKYEKIKTVNENHVLSLLLYHELHKELRNAHK